MSKKISKRFKKLVTNKKQKLPLAFDEALKLVKQNCNAKFEESIDVSLTLNLKQKKRRI